MCCCFGRGGDQGEEGTEGTFGESGGGVAFGGLVE